MKVLSEGGCLIGGSDPLCHPFEQGDQLQVAPIAGNGRFPIWPVHHPFGKERANTFAFGYFPVEHLLILIHENLLNF